MGGAELRGSYENYYYDISYLLFVPDRPAAKYPFSSHSCRLWLYAISCIKSAVVSRVVSHGSCLNWLSAQPQQQGLTRLQALAPETDARGLIVAFGRAYAARPNSCVLLAPRTAALACSSHRKALPPGGHFLRRFTARKRNCLRAAAPSEQLIKRSAHLARSSTVPVAR